ncbi:hypothetical protein [Actinacidiphila glaucinigra]|uniref:hypothetical protein n=1 Tax=Actinacidiphila glaucinigra TaxID=235986 RepID=UPI0015C680BB|nr:hypothetical protein [Actinacidiphila glaucinigra]
MDPRGAIAQRIPLIARFRPACLPLPERIQSLVELARSAADRVDQGSASAVFNQAALLASDLDLPDLANRWCHQHAAAYLHACPLPGMSAIRALEPIVNLARLHIRAGRANDGHTHLLSLYNAVCSGTACDFGTITVPAQLTRTEEDHNEVRAWLWRVLLADGTRALTATGRWDEALTHVQAHRGVGSRMLDGRQVAVIAALTQRDTAQAARLIVETAPGEPWEQQITLCLNVLRKRTDGKAKEADLEDLANSYTEDGPSGHGMTVFDIRHGLTILDLIENAENPHARRLAEDLYRRTMHALDGYAAREITSDPLFTTAATSPQIDSCHALIQRCGLNTRNLNQPDHALVSRALTSSSNVIHRSLAP